MLLRFIRYYKPHWRLFALDMTCSLVVAVCDLFYPMIAKDIINVYVPQRNLHALLLWAGILFGIYLLKACLTYVIQYWGHMVGIGMQGDMRRDMFRHMQKLPFAFFDENKTGALMSRMINDLQDLSELAHHGPEDLFLSVVLFIGSFVMLSQVNLPLTCIAFGAAPLVLWFAIAARTGMRTAFKESRVQTAHINAGVETAIAGMRVSRAYCGEEHENEKFDGANALFIRAKDAAYRAMAWFNGGTTFLTDMLYLVVLLAGGLFFFAGRIDAGSFAAFLLYMNVFLKPVNRFVAMIEQLQNGMTGFARFIEVIDQPPEAEDPNARDAGALQGHIRFEGVSFHYQNSDQPGEEAQVVRNLDLDIPAGRTLALVGPSGGGKTTLCNLIPRFYEVTSGRILIDGQDIRRVTLKSLRQDIGIVQQDVYLFSGTVAQNIAYGKPGATRQEIEAAARLAGAEKFILALKDGYDTYVGERGVKLSGGQKQRIAIARVFLKNPPILILDEATSALDNESEILVGQSLEKLAHGRTTLTIAHRLTTIKDYDRILVLGEEGIVEEGTHAQLLEKQGVYYRLWNQLPAEDGE